MSSAARLSKKSCRNQQVVAAPGPMTLGGKTFMVTSPTKADLNSLRKWVRSNYRRILGEREKADGITSEELSGLSPEHQLLLIREYARAKATERELTEAEATDVILSPEGTAMMVWLAARKYGDVTFEWLCEEITEENVGKTFEDFDAACGVQGEEGETDPKAAGSAS